MNHITVLCAMDEELGAFLSVTAEQGFSSADDVELPFLTMRGARVTAGEVHITAIRCGVGLAAAAAATAWAISALGADMVISAGTAGGLAADVIVGDVIVSTGCAYGSADATAFGYAYGQVPGQPPVIAADPQLRTSIMAAVRGGQLLSSTLDFEVREGQMLSGDSFITEANVGRMRELFPEALSTDMETTAIAQICASAQVPFASVRAISDLCGPDADRDHDLALNEVARRSAQVILGIVPAERA